MNAQQDAFDLNIINYSDKPDANIEHLHLLSLTNNSNKVMNYNISSQEIICKTEYDDVVRNKIGHADSNKDVSVNEKTSSSLTVEIYNKTLSKKIDQMILDPNESIEFYVKITRHNNTEMGTSKCFKIATHLLDNETIGKYVIIRAFIPNPNILRH
ncbi:hypothetical protein Q4Q39_09785 [Flavivirga amylovorans]|uniref:Uncharacterized protein n=2 Tax=Flavivirga amylovorans TaxID=870486 RepID=A0ABT8X164_9FLAO|nr:hypothetical protein [Flavivirga amylovorans]MDO5987688.1 hypothetical protein [Flavivirga amylovorans]